MDHVGLVGLVLIGGTIVGCLIAIRRMRRRTGQWQESKQFKRRLPTWVRVVEKTTLIVIWAGVGGGLFVSSIRALAPPHFADGHGPITLLLAVYVGTWAPAAILSNLVIWMVPPIRRANQEAMTGSRLSLRRFNIELAVIGLVAGIFALALAALALRP